ncbi:MAG: ferritin [Candidatus Adiutrix sp.]|jgi:ferritin|nr:ferritin [Candidatus Adiutrix sp.]
MLSKKMTTALNGQVTAELYSAYLYLAMGAWLKKEGYGGAAHWMDLQVREEIFHAEKMHNYILDRGGQMKPGPIEAPPFTWKSPLAVFEKAYEHEQKVTGFIGALMSLAKDEGDHATEIFLQWFVTEQIEEEAAALEIAQKYRLAQDQAAGLFAIDQQLSARSLSVQVKNALAGDPAAAK